MYYVTTYTRTLVRRKGPEKGRTVRHASFYSTKSLTPMHEVIRGRYPGSKTYEGEKIRVVTHFFPSLPLDQPIVTGGRLIAQS